MGFWDDDYDFANGAPFGDFDMDDDGKLDIFEKSQKLDYYSDLWKDEDKASNLYDDDDIFDNEISPLDSSEIRELDLLLATHDKNKLDDLADVYGVSTEYLKKRGVELGYFEDDDEDSNWLEDDEDEERSWLDDDDKDDEDDDEDSNWLEDGDSSWLNDNEDSSWLNDNEDSSWMNDDEDSSWLDDDDSNWLNDDEDDSWLDDDEEEDDDGTESIEKELEEIYQEDIGHLAQKYNLSESYVIYKALQYGFFLENSEPEENEQQEPAESEYMDDAYFASDWNKEDIMDSIVRIFLMAELYIEENKDEVGSHVLDDPDYETINKIYYKLEDKSDKIFNLAYNYLLNVMDEFERHPATRNMAALIVLGVVCATCSARIRSYFIIKNWNKKIAARYLIPDEGFDFDRAVNENLQLGKIVKTCSLIKECDMSDMILNIAKKDFDKAMDVWLWLLENFFPYRDYAFQNSKIDYISQVLFELEMKYSDSLEKYFKRDSKLKETLCSLGDDDIYMDIIRKAGGEELSVCNTSRCDEWEKSPGYMYCGVIFAPTRKKIYHYRSRNESVKVGDIVRVWSENSKRMVEVTVVSVGYYSEMAVPYPLDKAKFIEK